MKHNYTDEQLQLTILDASDQRSIFIRTAHELEDIDSSAIQSLRTLLYHLPDPDNEWEQCTIDQIRKGDRVRWQDPGLDDTCIYEIIADHTEAEDPGWILFSKTESYYFPPGAVVDRIPKKIVHPDPAEHPVIYVKECDLVNFIPKIMVWYRDSYVAGQQCLSPEQITDWQQIDPAKVVADDE